MGATQWSRQYQYDAADNRSGQLSYRYDPVGRLQEAAPPKGVESFRFDPAGNLLDNAPAADGHQDDSLLGNLLSQYAGRHYRYDSRGNLVEKRVNGSLTRLEWDSHNRLSRLIAPDGQRTDYHYDPLGRRIAKISQGEATLYGWDGDVLAFETRDEAAVHYLFEPASFVPLAQVHTDAIRGVKVPAWSQHHPYDPDKDPLRQAAPEPEAPKAVYYYHTDHLGTPQALTDEQGRLALEMDYQAWGQAREVIADAASKAGIRNPFRFQEQYHDDESGLHYNRHRYYDPEIGRFISRDPIGLMGGINIHSYAPNPVEWVDPFGLSKTSSSSGRKQKSDKPNQNAKCPCRKKWEVNRFDRVCAGNVPGVGHAKYLRDPSTGMWWSEDQTGHGNSAWKVFDKNGAWVADADIYGDYMNKHKSEVGKNINFNSLKCKDSK
ncbi:RHS repeat domain-containing protein [Chromobacterium violaceum]|uniref:RHS repeat domain-containing protein n=1 Tax=Chromobacterium violaceum TaxID=536 RepID=UPI0009D92F85|nr:RHS repeat-associated core domain-containing protein [Chromobacterium violaceum]OQS47592.1 hypothetical protein B0T48_13045 [Chromobacterium violaceum]OQS48483.1 hypothetical protein B0T49_15975 [Chromobacterium violaceum]QRO34870.1 RHS domain-containing protein [Chromobacterium violaceum]QRQ15325.1 RHS domain-containing protein [Chromobacterium violaceum]